MKKLVAFAPMVAVMMMSSMPAFAEVSQAQKDDCLLASRNCVTQVDDIYQKMHKLDNEIKKGTKVYTADELKKLQTKLDETAKLLKDMEME